MITSGVQISLADEGFSRFTLNSLDYALPRKLKINLTLNLNSVIYFLLFHYIFME